jgi:hypothetical protein
LVIKALDPYWSPTSNSGSGSGKNEYGSTTLVVRYQNCPEDLIFLEEIISLSGAHPGTRDNTERA